ncbi:MAG: amino acid permease [Gammaproteobacteria bacterium]|nr:amino acid permease [Gammaproteobacteria bacterium]
MMPTVSLQRRLSLTQMVLYGLGTTIGAGIYALVGELAAISGYMAPAAFLMASLMAGLTALSFAELSSRYPRAAGASLYVKQGFGSDTLALFVGLLVFLAGVISSAALINAFTGYLAQFFELHRFITILIIALTIGLLAAWGIAESVFIASLITLIEIGGLLLIIFNSQSVFADLPSQWHKLMPGTDSANWWAIYAGALLGFYAFIGFEDMVDVAEEIHNVRRNLPLAIIITLSVTTLLYMLIMLAAVLAMPPQQLAKENAPLIALYRHFSGEHGFLLNIIAMFAIINGVLIQTIMASRVLYGLSCRGHLHVSLSQVHYFTRTPLIATALAISCVFVFALLGDLSTLAETTSLLMLCIFSLVNLALWRIKRRNPRPPGIIVLPACLPVLGFFVSAAFALSQLLSLFNDV